MLLSALITISALVPNVLGNPVANCDTTYTVKSGDYCYKIAQNFGMADYHTLDTYNSAAPNPLKCDVTILAIGQVLCVHTAAALTPTPSVKASPAASIKASPAPSIKASPAKSVTPSPAPSIKASPAKSPAPSIKASPAPSIKASPTPSKKASPAPSPTVATNLTPLQIAQNPADTYMPIAGRATYFTDTQTLCLGYGAIPQYAVALNWMTGMSSVSYDPNFCWKCVYVWTAKGSFTAKVVDVCDKANCGINDPSHLDIHGTAAFSVVGNVVDGLIPINWEWVPC
ncbi:hypothetical protein SmJEL517_g04818 [Synchytrium microbalum]|uniref:LysM domain-containing protein n=1 Tax=Synchytrium microbalum TaxID=1806994 RepID=A0A507C356_9FUNG|nr:uncharacterized protein SmJEL517_g04818 [Synchytrium microbalum]TPX31975.1 hypothetical protein SmJEL517_g04818 [Synchytrium microbalum]